MAKLDVTNPKIRQAHIELIGPIGAGKTEFIENMVKSDIQSNQGLCLIDPRGRVYEDLVRWSETAPMFARPGAPKILRLNPAQPRRSSNFSPLRLDANDITDGVDALVNACARVWAREHPERRPFLKCSLRIVFRLLAENKLTLLDGPRLLEPNNQKARANLIPNLADPLFREEWQALNALPARLFGEQFEAAANRLLHFLSSPGIKNLIRKGSNAIDFRKIMDEGQCLFVNLAASAALPEDSARLLGALIVNDLFLKAQARPPGSRPFSLYICLGQDSPFLTENFRRILEEGREYGLFLILAHQNLAQLKQAGDDLYHAVLANTKTKLIFGELSPDDTQALSGAKTIDIHLED